MGGFIAERLSAFGTTLEGFIHSSDMLWVLFGFFGQFFFTMRFLVQWLASEKAQKSVIPDLFWLFSIGGGAVLFIYALHKQDPVFIFGQGLGLIIYFRNLHFVLRDRRKKKAEG